MARKGEEMVRKLCEILNLKVFYFAESSRVVYSQGETTTLSQKGLN